jgi:hypothetical protein
LRERERERECDEKGIGRHIREREREREREKYLKFFLLIGRYANGERDVRAKEFLVWKELLNV